MRRMNYLLVMIVVLAFAACGTSEPVAECNSSNDCSGDPGDGCHWMCKDHKCKEVCTEECETADDCNDLPWESQCIGHWECSEKVCKPVCDPVVCTNVADCLDLEPPEDCEGHWECLKAECTWVCDKYPCETAPDCADVPWPLRCLGYWECNDGYCDPICGSPTCESAKDCEGLQLPCAEGYWVCSDSQCLPVCESTCQSVADCLHNPWDVKCMGHWACEDDKCVEVCDFENCGDGTCDHQGGESPASCPIDCAAACVEEGLPTGVPPACCPGLDALSDCVPDQPCPGSLFFCVNCGSQSCDPHENPYNCLDDCPEGCPVGEERSFTCPGGGDVPWCVCRPPKCRPVCMYVGSYSEGWYDSCSGSLIDWAMCDGHETECFFIGTESEGWYDIEDNSTLISWAYCAPLWDCLIDPKVQCF